MLSHLDPQGTTEHHLQASERSPRGNNKVVVWHDPGGMGCARSPLATALGVSFSQTNSPLQYVSCINLSFPFLTLGLAEESSEAWCWQWYPS